MHVAPLHGEQSCASNIVGINDVKTNHIVRYYDRRTRLYINFLLSGSVKYRLLARIDHRHPASQLSACSLRTFLRDYPGKCLAITDRKSQIGFFAHAEANRKKSTMWSLCRRGERRLSQTRSKMDDAKDVYEEKRLLGPFHSLTMSYEGSN